MEVGNKTQMPSIRLTPRPKYLSLTLTAIQRAITYRGTTLLNLFSNFIWAILVYSLWKAVFSSKGSLKGFSWDEMRTYIILAFAINALFSFQSLMRIMNTIRTGEVASELLRPHDYLGSQLAQATGAACVEGALSGGIAILLSFWFLGIVPPASPLSFGLFLLSICFGFLTKFLLGYLVAMLCFYTLNAVGLIWTQTAIINLFSGSLIPLSFFPDWLMQIVLITPFQSIVYAPIAIYLGKISGIGVWQTLSLQAVWVILLWLLAKVLWRVSIRQLDIQGG